MSDRFGVEQGAGEKVDEILEVLDEIDVAVEDIDFILVTERLVQGPAFRYEGELRISWHNDE